MLPKIKTLEPTTDYCLKVTFDDGKTVLYNVKEDIDTIPCFKNLQTVQGLFAQVQLDDSRTVVYWNEDIDLPSHALYEFGKVI